MITRNIVNGPSKAQLFQSFERRYSGAETQVRFVTEDNEMLSGVINSLEYEDGSSYSFNFKGFFHGNLLNGYYHAKSRTGWIEIKRAGKTCWI